ncbi:MAG: Uncharacterized protein G01um101417_107 [Parcubacteria group bacterium Gr01-1014_17]|nr:MAG: Uncharacterized protein G01um101417_107 [Parcubacteria group bacterium Gr01-1014_17]
MTWLTRRVGVSVLFLIPLTPLAVYLGFLFPYTSGRNFFFRALALMALACWILLWVQSPERFRPRSSFLVWAMSVFIILIGSATMLAPYPSLAFWSTLERMDGLVGALFLAAFFFSASHLLDEKSWKIFFNTFIGTAIIVSVIALLQLVSVLPTHQGVLRIDATVGNPSFFAAYMLLSAGLGLFLASGEMVRRRRLMYTTCSALFVFLALASGTRSAFVALPVALFVSGSAAFLLCKESVSIKRFSIAALAGLALFVGLFFALRQIPSATAHPLLGRLLSISLTGQDAEARFLSWKIALQGAKERSLFGWGPEGYRSVFVKYYDPRLYGREQWFDRAHNTYLDWLVQAGGIGLLAYLALWVGLARAVWSRRVAAFSSWEKVALSGMFAGYAAFNIFSFDTVTSSIIFFSFLAYAESKKRFAEYTITSPQPPLKGGASENRRMFFIFLVCAIASIIFYFTIAKPAVAAHAINLGLRSPSPNLDERLGYFTRAISLNTFATTEAREMLAQFAVDVSSVPLKDESRAKIVSLVTQELSQQIAESPGDPRYLLRLGTVLNTYRQYAAAVPFLEKAVALSPNKQPSLYEWGTSFLNMGKFDKAVTIFKQAADILPDGEDIESKRLYAISLVYARKYVEADAYMKKIFGETMFLDNRLADSYERVGQYEKAEYIRKKIEEEQ